MKTYKDLMEKTLTPAELKKREEIAKAMEKENPGMNMGKKMAIATAAAKRVAESEELDESTMDKDHPIVKEYEALKKNHDIKSLRSMIKGQGGVIDTSEFKSKDHAISHLLRNKHGSKKVAAAFGLKESEELDDVLDEGLGKDLKRLATGKDVKSRAGQEIAKSQDASMKGDNKTANKHFKRYDKLDKLANKGVAKGKRGLMGDNGRIEEGDRVDTPLGRGTVNAILSLSQKVGVHLDSGQDKDFYPEDVMVINSQQGVAEGSTNKDMTGQTCEKCKKGKYQERSQHDDMQGKVTCECGHRVDRWKKYKEQGVMEETMQTTISFKEFQAKLEEAIDSEHYRATSEPSQFGGHRPKVVHKGKGTVMYLGQHSYKTKSAAAEGAKVYLDAYEKIGEKAASRDAAAHAKNHADAIKEEVELDEGSTIDHAKVFKSETDTMKPGSTKWVGRAGGKEVHAKKDAKGNVKFYHRDGIKGPSRSVTNEEVESIDEVNHREFAEAGKMHPTMARVMKTGSEIDFYSSENGDKLSGKVTKNDGKNVHVQANKDGKVGGGKTHKFAVSKNLNGQIHEENELDEADYDWSKVGAWGRRTDKGSSIDWNSDKKSSSTDTGTVHKAREVARNPEGGEVQKRGRGRPAGEYKGTYKARDPEGKAASSAKAQASKADGLAARKEFKTSMDAAIRQRQLEIWKKASKAAK